MKAGCFSAVADPDQVLVERWQAGDDASGQALFGRHLLPVFRFFAKRVSVDADDLVQRTFLGCVRSRERFRGACSFRTFLFAIARHELCQHLRATRRRQRVESAVSGVADPVVAAAHLDLQQRAALLQRALRALPIEQQIILEMHYWYELEPTQLAEVFEIPAATARTKLFRARKGLRAILRREDPEGLRTT